MYLKKEKRRAGWCRTIQLLMWVLLIAVQAAAVLQLEVRAETQAEEFWSAEQETQAEEFWSAEQETQPEEFWSAEQETQPGELQQVEQEVWFESVEAADEIPQQIEAEAEVNGDTVTVTCDLVEQEEEACFWQGDFVLPVTFHVYDADYYLLGGRRVPADPGEPRLEGYENELLAEAGLEPEYYRIEEISWEGEAYEDAQGELCRDALVCGSRLMRNVRARYAGTVRVAAPPEPVTEPAGAAAETASEIAETEETAAESVADEKNIVVFKSEEEPGITAAEEGEQEKFPLSGWLLRMTQTLLVTIGIGAALFLTGLVLLAGLHMAKYARLWYISRRNRK